MNNFFKGGLIASTLLANQMSFNLTAQEAPKQPNFLFILIDDLGGRDLSCYGSTFYETPNLDKLAKDGVKFNQAYTVNPVCSPTRASILSGKYPSRLNMTNHSGIQGPTGPNYKLIAPIPNGSLPLTEKTIASVLKEHNYETIHIGKWHVQAHNDKTRTFFPEAHGFNKNIAGTNAGQPASFFFPYKDPKLPQNNVPDLADGKEGDYLTDALTTKAIELMKECKVSGKPFFINMWHFSVHTPIQAPAELVTKYRKKIKEMKINEHSPGVKTYNSYQRAAQTSPFYAAMVENMDYNVGRLLKALKDNDLDDNTVVIFFSDNGGLSTGSRDGLPTSNLPLKAGKGWVYEGGIKVPLIIKWPGVTAGGTESNEVVISTDLYPTMLEMAHLPLLKEQHLDGISLAKHLKDSSKLERKATYFYYPHYHQICSMGPAIAVRMGDYKLVERFEDGTLELFNIVKDEAEANDISAKNPELTQTMKSMIDAWLKEQNAKPLKVNPNFKGEIAKNASK